MSRQVVIAIVIVVLIALLGWWLWPGGEEPEPEPEPAPPAAEEIPVEEPEPEEEVDAGLPPLEASDEAARDAMRVAGVGGPLSAALSQEDLVRRFAAAVAAVSRGREPRSQLRFLAPEEPFRVTEQEGELVVDPRSYDRYDGIARAFGGLDAGEIAAQYRRLEPLFADAWRDLGETGSFRTAMLQALDLLLATPVPETPIRVQDEVSAYAYVDDELQELSPAQKALARFGPDNQRIVRNKLRQIRSEIAGGG